MPLPENNQKPPRQVPELERTQEIPTTLLAAALSQAKPGSEKSDDQTEIGDDELAGSLPPQRIPLTLRFRRYRLWIGGLIVLLVAIPIVLTVIGAITSPPHIKGIPMGHFVYLEADVPSEKTTTLRGLFLTDPSGASRLLTHEYEPQDTDGGVREWITQPALSPDGTRLAFEKQLISLQEEKQSVDNQIWVMDLTSGTTKVPHMVMDLTAQHFKQIVGLAWDSASSVVFLQDDIMYSVSTDTEEKPLRTPLDMSQIPLALSPDISATRSPSLSTEGAFSFSAVTAGGSEVVIEKLGGIVPGPAAAVFALNPQGDKIAFVSPDGGSVIHIFNVISRNYAPDIPVRWGWSAFGKRQITSLRWSPDGTQLAFTVSKPPVPDDEIFVVGTDGQTRQLPYRTGRSAWDWGQ